MKIGLLKTNTLTINQSRVRSRPMTNSCCSSLDLLFVVTIIRYASGNGVTKRLQMQSMWTLVPITQNGTHSSFT